MSHVWTDGKGIRYDKPNCTRIELPWTKVVKYYDALVESGRFAPSEELGQRYGEVIDGALAEEQPEITEPEQPVVNETTSSEPPPPVPEESEPAVWEYNEIKSAHPEDIVLYQVGDFFEIYGEDAKQAAPVLDLHLGSRPIPTGGRVDMCGIPAHQLEENLEKLRLQHPVTVSAVSEDGSHNTYSLAKLEPPVPVVEEQLEKYKPIVAAAITEDTAYRNACGHSDRENAVIEGNAAVRRAILNSGDLELIRLYSDVPEFRHHLHQEVIDETYPKLQELLRPLSQDDIDTAIRAWNGSVESKHAVVRYMKDHARDRDTAAWLSREYDGGESPFVIRSGSPEQMELPWPKVQRRIAQLIKAEKFYTEEEYDRLDDIDPVAIREQLAEHGIVNGEVVDADKLDAAPIVRQAEADAQRISDEEFAREYLIPGESTFEIDGRTFLVDRVNLDFG
ncbi:MAG: hypothetical protein MR426_09390, partial [Clostridiales bacterium]|nr:hypothetical protein [Clostridiales bacterium]